MFAEAAHQALGQHGQQAGGQQVGLHAHVDQARNRAGGIIGVERGQHEMPGQRGAHHQLRGLGVAGFPDQDDIRILPQQRPQAAAEGQAHVLIDLRLPYEGHAVFNGVFQREDADLHGADLIENGVERGGFAAARRPATSTTP